MLMAQVSSELDRQRFAAVGQALADPKRLCVLESLQVGELSVSDLAEDLVAAGAAMLVLSAFYGRRLGAAAAQ